MAENLTPQQRTAVTDRGGKLLVSAAAGSGKTKVLVDRLLSYILDPVSPANIDDFLIITYTKAAASELRGKIAGKLSEHIAAEPENRHLQRQMQKLYLTKISTVHAFCTDLIREYAYALDVSADFRVSDERESLELQIKALDQVLEEAYETIGTDADFEAFVNTQGFGRDDRQVPETILKVFNSARCHLNPQQWLDWCIQICEPGNISDVGQTDSGKYLLEQLRDYTNYHINSLNACANKGCTVDGFEKPVALFQDIIVQLERLVNSETWDATVQNSLIDYGRLTFPRKCSDPELAEKFKAVRNACKKGLEKKLRSFQDMSFQVIADMRVTASATRGMISLVEKFTVAYDKLKKSRRVLDFSDLEHKTLDLLIGKKRGGSTALAKEIGSRFREVMVDEYQDSNAVQDAIFSALTECRQNCFMVGDVKQSIYQFRLADPTIFLSKYNSYVRAGQANSGEGRKVMLSSNFRSASAVIEAVNYVFSTCMSPKVGGLHYGDDEALSEGLPHTQIDEPEVELHGICVQEDTYAEEAEFTAQRIRQLLDNQQLVRGKNGSLRPVTEEDIVILLRSPGSVGGEFAYALAQKGLCCAADAVVDLLQTEEISVLRSLLQVVSNPLQDIPLLAVLSSRVFAFTADELAALRAGNRGSDIYTALQKSSDTKVCDFLSILTDIRNEARICDLSHLLEYVFAKTRLDSIYAAMPNGNEKVENLHAFCQIAAECLHSRGFDLSRFLEYLDAMDEHGLSPVSDTTPKGVIRIMSIHKSKGLEFPVVFLCGLSRSFNRESINATVLCDRELGLGLSCVDTVNRVRYPSAAKRAISGKILADSLSEEMRVLYVAMTRARDRLIMTYASASLENEISDLTARMDLSETELLAADADCPGKWVLLSALRRSEAGALFALGGRPEHIQVSQRPWLIQTHHDILCSDAPALEESAVNNLDKSVPMQMARSLVFDYPFTVATKTPSKQTATQLKGRYKDQEIAENALPPKKLSSNWRKPSFVSDRTSGKVYGTAIHAVMQFIDYQKCVSKEGIVSELDRLVEVGYISKEQREYADADKLAAFFLSDIGRKISKANNILREFKFTILDDGKLCKVDAENEKILLQGVVDCAVVDDDGIIVLDFKTDRVSDTTVEAAAGAYRPQVDAYADALSRIYELPVKEKWLYFFHIDRFISLS